MHHQILYGILVTGGLMLSVINAFAGDARLYQQDSAGNIQYHKPSAAIHKDGRIIEADSVGNKQYHKQQYQIKDGKVYQTDSAGNIQYHKPKGVIKK